MPFYAMDESIISGLILLPKSYSRTEISQIRAQKWKYETTIHSLAHKKNKRWRTKGDEEFKNPFNFRRLPLIMWAQKEKSDKTSPRSQWKSDVRFSTFGVNDNANTYHVKFLRHLHSNLKLAKIRQKIREYFLRTCPKLEGARLMFLGSPYRCILREFSHIYSSELCKVIFGMVSKRHNRTKIVFIFRELRLKSYQLTSVKKN